MKKSIMLAMIGSILMGMAGSIEAADRVGEVQSQTTGASAGAKLDKFVVVDNADSTLVLENAAKNQTFRVEQITGTQDGVMLFDLALMGTDGATRMLGVEFEAGGAGKVFWAGFTEDGKYVEDGRLLVSSEIADQENPEAPNFEDAEFTFAFVTGPYNGEVLTVIKTDPSGALMMVNKIGMGFNFVEIDLELWPRFECACNALNTLCPIAWCRRTTTCPRVPNENCRWMWVWWID